MTEEKLRQKFIDERPRLVSEEEAGLIFDEWFSWLQRYSEVIKRAERKPIRAYLDSKE